MLRLILYSIIRIFFLIFGFILIGFWLFFITFGVIEIVVIFGVGVEYVLVVVVFGLLLVFGLF